MNLRSNQRKKPPKRPTGGSYYLKKTKTAQWTLYKHSYEGGKRTQKRVPDLAYRELGLDPSIETTWSHYKDKDQVNFVETTQAKRAWIKAR